LNRQHQQTLANIGAATLQLEAAKAQLPQIEQQQRQLTQEVIQRLGIQDFVGARIEEGNVIVRFRGEAPDLGVGPRVVPQLQNGKEKTAE